MTGPERRNAEKVLLRAGWRKGGPHYSEPSSPAWTHPKAAIVPGGYTTAEAFAYESRPPAPVVPRGAPRGRTAEALRKIRELREGAKP